jgi:hypothetical protein
VKQLISALDGTVVFARRYPLVSAAVMLQAGVVAVPLNLVAGSPPYFGAVFVCIATFLVLWGLSHERGRLEARMNAAEGGLRWAVRINGVMIGELTDARYARIRHAAFFDARVHFAQLMNLVATILRIFDWLLKTTPLLLFWMAVGMLAYAPDMFQEVLRQIQVLSPREVVAGISANAGTITGFAAIVSGTQAMFGGSTFGAVDRFDEEIGESVRRAMDCPAEGRVTLCPATDPNKDAAEQRVHGV